MQDLSATAERPWHAETAEAALERCRSSAEGLTSDEAANRLELNGPNRLPAGKPRSLLARLFAQFNNLLIYVLLASAVITILLRHALDAVVILAVVLINAAIGFIQEGRAEKALEAIRAMLTREASVLRDGRRLTVPAESLVVGDVVLTEAGDRIPADLRLLRAANLRIEEAALTGESAPADKSTDPVAPDASLGDRASMAYSGTLVASGQGAGLVVATGAATELGRISAMVGDVDSLTTPLLRQMNAFARRLTIVILALAACVCVFAVMARGYEIEQAFMAAVGVAVAAIPEGLPAVMTITLAIGVKRMAERNAIIRRLPAVETLGAVSTICSDKTGTLTLNQMTVGAVVTASAEFEATGAGYEPRGDILRDRRRDRSRRLSRARRSIARAALLCNDASLRQAGGRVDRRRRSDGGRADRVRDQGGRGPGGAQTRIAAAQGDSLRRPPSLHGDPQSRRRGRASSPSRARPSACSSSAPAALRRPATNRWMRRRGAERSTGSRPAASASSPSPRSRRAMRTSLELDDVEKGGLTLLRPRRPHRSAAAGSGSRRSPNCKAAGIDVKMITGDHASTAAAIARELGLGEGTVDALTGRAIDAMDDAALRRALPTTAVFARTSPEHKLRLVEALQADGAVVSMTGDGVNDAPALKRADVGVAMGRKGTEAAKEAAEMVLADDNFATIAAAVREGRIVYDNLVKVLGWALPTNGGEAMAIVAAILLGVTLPMTPAQILWVNMVTGVTLGLVFAFDPAEPGVMQRPPRDPRAPILSAHLVWRTALVSVLFCVVVFAVFFWALRRGEELEHAQTFAVNAMVGLEIAYLFSVRLRHGAPFDFRAIRVTRALAIGIGAVVVLQILFTYLPPLEILYDTRPIDLPDMGVVAAAAIGLILVLELEKAIRIGLFGSGRG